MPLRIVGWIIGLSLPLLWWVSGELGWFGGEVWLLFSCAVMFLASFLMRSYLGAYLVPLIVVIVADVIQILVDGWDTFTYDSGFAGQVIYDVMFVFIFGFVGLLGMALGTGVKEAKRQIHSSP